MLPTLYIGNKNTSSWSLRPWLALSQAHIQFREELIALDQVDTQQNLLRVSPSGRVPCLVHGAVRVWESLAICEYAAETWPEATLWPLDPYLRAQARSVSHEMHAGFSALRNQCPMAIAADCRGRALSEDTQRDIARIRDIWTSCLDLSGGPFLFGAFSIADAMYAPVATRFVTYGIALDSGLQTYADTLLSLPAMRRWRDDAVKEATSKPVTTARHNRI